MGYKVHVNGTVSYINMQVWCNYHETKSIFESLPALDVTDACNPLDRVAVDCCLATVLDVVFFVSTTGAALTTP
jgi:hypothetical protein